jgi:hypothetical protein
MGTPAPDAVKLLVDHFDQDREVFLSGNCKEEQLPKAKTLHEQESLKRTIGATDRQIDTPVYELYGFAEVEVRIVEGEGNGTPGVCGMSPNCEGG